MIVTVHITANEANSLGNIILEETEIIFALRKNHLGTSHRVADFFTIEDLSFIISIKNKFRKSKTLAHHPWVFQHVS